MAYRLRTDESVRRGLRRLATKEIRAAREHLRPNGHPRDEGVHEARKNVKKIRAILEVVAAADARGLGDSRKRLRRVNRVLSRLRDADAMIKVLGDLRARDPNLVSEHTFARVRRELLSHKRTALEAAEREGAWIAVDRQLRKLGRGVKRWRPRDHGFDVLARGIRLTHRNGREAMARARTRQTAIDFHEWRKQMKTLWYDLRLVESAGRTIRRDADALHRAETCLGEDHNVVVLCSELSKEKSLCDGLVDIDRLRVAGDQYRCELRAKAFAAAARIYRRKPRTYVRAIADAWKASRRRGTVHRGRRRAAA